MTIGRRYHIKQESPYQEKIDFLQNLGNLIESLQKIAIIPTVKLIREALDDNNKSYGGYFPFRYLPAHIASKRILSVQGTGIYTNC